jgi:N-acetylmuramoyl-L-alanine amidase
VNARSIGIELVNPGHEFGYVPFPDEQIAALIALAQGVLVRHPIPARRVLGHSDVAPNRKTDPGELFPWERLAEAGIGLYPPLPEGAGGAVPASEALPIPDPSPYGGENAVSQMLSDFGYGVPPEVDWPLETTISAFQRHFRPSRIDSVADGETVARLETLLGISLRNGSE